MDKLEKQIGDIILDAIATDEDITDAITSTKNGTTLFILEVLLLLLKRTKALEDLHPEDDGK